MDDEQENLDTFLLNFGRKLDVRTARSGEEALEVCMREEIAVVVSDQRMPKMTGTELLARLKRVRPETIRMIVTGYTDLEAVVVAINEGAISRYITKPWDAQALERILRGAIDQYRHAVLRRQRIRELSAYNHILGMIAGDLSTRTILKEVLKITAFELGFDRVFVLLGDPDESDALSGQALTRAEENRPVLESFQTPAGGIPIETDGAARKSFSVQGVVDGAERVYACAPFYAAPLVTAGRTVGVFAAGFTATDSPPAAVSPHHARAVTTLADQIAVAVQGGLEATHEKVDERRAHKRRRRLEAPEPDVRHYPLLVVDDEAENRDAFALNFGETFTVYTAGSGEEAREIYEKKPVSVIITDQRMPGMTGVDLLASARESDPDCVRIILTGYSDLQDVIDAVNRGLVYRYLQKPWDVAEMEATIRMAIDYYQELVEGRRLLREAEAVNRLMSLMLTDAGVDRLTQTVLAVCTEELGHDRAYAFRYDEERVCLQNGLACGRPGMPLPEVDKLRIPVIKGGGLLSRAALADRPITSTVVVPSEKGGVEFVARDAREFCAVPVTAGDRLFGVLAVDHTSDNPVRITPLSERTLTTLANQLAITLQSAVRS